MGKTKKKRNKTEYKKQGYSQIKRLEDREVLSIVSDIRFDISSPYQIDLGSGDVYKFGKQLKPKKSGRDQRYLSVQLSFIGKRKQISVHKLVWMVATQSLIPENFEIHHWDGVTTNNSFNNLFCLHKKDHGKLHAVEDWTFDVESF